MATIIKKGTNPSCFRLRNGKVINLFPDVLTVLTDEEEELLMSEYGSFIMPRVITESKPNGCFILSHKKEYSADMNKEVGKVLDNSSKIEIEHKENNQEVIEVKETSKRGRRKK